MFLKQCAHAGNITGGRAEARGIMSGGYGELPLPFGHLSILANLEYALHLGYVDIPNRAFLRVRRWAPWRGAGRLYSAPASSAVGSIATASTSVWSSASTQRMEGANGIHHGRSEGRGCAWHPVQAVRPPMDDMVGVERPPRVLPADHGGGGVIIDPVKLPPHGIEHLRQAAGGSPATRPGVDANRWHSAV